MEDIKDMVGNLLTEGTVRGALLAFGLSLLGVCGRAGWKWLTKPCPLSPLTLGVVEYLLHDDRLEDSSHDRYSGKVLTPRLETNPSYGWLWSEDAGENVWSSLTRHERKRVKSAYKALRKALEERREEKAQEYNEKAAEKAAKALAPFVRGRS